MRAHPVTHWKVSGDEGHLFCNEVRKYCKGYHHLKKNNKMNGTAAERALTRSREIPSRRVLVSDPSLMPHDYSTTPGGTIFSTTPGGTRIIYERKFLLDLRNSPLSRTPPANLPSIPGVTCEDNGDTTIHEEENQKVPESPPVNKPPEKHGQEGEDDHQFQMEI